MRRNLYIAAFVVVLLVACVGGFIGGRVLLARLQGDFAPRPTATLPAAVLPTATQPIAGGETQPLPTAVMPPGTETRSATATVLVVPAPMTDQPAVFTPQATWTAGVELPTVAPGELSVTPVGDAATPAPSATPIPAYPYLLARPIRYTSGDCPGTYALGSVIDRSGKPVPGVRLSLVDEYGNAATAVTKPGPGDTGRYDFPMSGPPRRFFMMVVDDTGRPQSPRVEILHDLAPYDGKGCRWVDWRGS